MRRIHIFRSLLLPLLFLLFVCPILSGCVGRKPAVVTDQNGEMLFTIGEEDKTDYTAFSDLVRTEARAALGKDAERLLSSGGLRIETTLDPACFRMVMDGYRAVLSDTVTFGCVLTDREGKILAVCSAGKEGENFALKKGNPYSAFKPLAVYTPAIESGTVCWSSLISDSPYKQIEGENGLQDWPVNASGVYTMRNVSLAKAVRLSLNTVAVKVLAAYGVNRSMGLLYEKFDIPLEGERLRAVMNGEEEIIGNLAMGYLEEGVSPLDMAGYYSVFLAEGKYTRPYAITKITDGAGKVMYEAKPEAADAFDPAAADIMNHLLREVVTKDATGEKAAVPGLDCAGKTGTGVTGDGNWFVGFSPEYICAIRHGEENGQNDAPAVFSAVFGSLPHEEKKFKDGKSVACRYCLESGKKATGNCTKTAIGYYLPDQLPDLCNSHLS